jgi:predicted RNA-binding Zn ribbon-like protein
VASVVVDGLVVPVSVAGHPALDFCNTRAGWGAPAPKEYLHSHAHLVLWARENGLLAPAEAVRVGRAGRRDPAAGAAVLARALALRDALRPVVLGAGRRADWAVVNAEVARAAALAELRPGSEPGPAEWGPPPGGTVDRPLLAVAWAVARFLTSAGAGHVAACPGTGCGWVFVDQRDRRRWCSMAWCGNRSKVRRHAERARESTKDFA